MRKTEVITIIFQTVLFIDDYVDVAQANKVQMAITLEGYEISKALTLAAAREYLSHRSPDAILLKTVMPDGSGIDFYEEIHCLTEAYVLFQSPCKTDEEEKRAFETGCADYFCNLASAEEIALRVTATMRRRYRESELSRSCG